MLMRVLTAVVALGVAFAIVVALQPADFTVVRTARVAAPATVVFEQVNDFHKWGAWNPWAKLDPAMKQTYEGAPSGAGAVYAWAGDRNVGEGRMTIVESQPPQRLRIQLDFLKPMAATNTAEFRFEPQADGQTAVTWSMSGKNGFMAKAIGLFMDMDEMVGGMFDQGLADMKSAAETANKG
jgi:uncharacterized protein YndB with AHSA1/START domain